MGLIIEENLRKNLKQTYLWRYMSLAKFIDLLTTQSMYFATNKQLITGDPYEGTLPFFTNLLFTLPENCESAEHNQVNLDIDKIRNNTYINCWHINEDENYLMWQSYAPEKGDVAILTDIESLLDSFETNLDINAILVNYSSKDFNKELANINSSDYKNKAKLKVGGLGSSKYKKEIFKNESELTLIFQLDNKNEINPKIKINLDKLIKGIYVSPKSTVVEKQTIINTLNILKNNNIISFEPNKIVYNSFISDAYLQESTEIGRCLQNFKQLYDANKNKTPYERIDEGLMGLIVLLTLLPDIPPHKREKVNNQTVDTVNDN